MVLCPDFVILWLFQWSLTLFKSSCKIFAKQNHRHSMWRMFPRCSVPCSTISLNKSIHQLDLLRLKKDHHPSIRWLAGDDVYLCDLTLAWSSCPLKWNVHCIAAAMPFSVPQSETSSCGQLPTSLTHSKKSYPGTLGSLLVLTTSSHGIRLQNPSIAIRLQFVVSY